VDSRDSRLGEIATEVAARVFVGVSKSSPARLTGLTEPVAVNAPDHIGSDGWQPEIRSLTNRVPSMTALIAGSRSRSAFHFTT